MRCSINRLNPTYATLVEEQPLPDVAKVSTTASADYTAPISPRLNAILAATVQYIGASGLTFDPRTPKLMGAYTTARLSAGLHAARWQMSFYIDNPANTVGNTFGYGNPFSFRDFAQRTPQRPRTVGLSFGAHY